MPAQHWQTDLAQQLLSGLNLNFGINAPKGTNQKISLRMFAAIQWLEFRIININVINVLIEKNILN